MYVTKLFTFAWKLRGNEVEQLSYDSFVHFEFKEDSGFGSMGPCSDSGLSLGKETEAIKVHNHRGLIVTTLLSVFWLDIPVNLF